MAYRLSPVTRASLAERSVRLRGLRLLAVAERPAQSPKERWAERVEDEWGAWGTLYHAERRPPARLRPVRAVRPVPAGSRAAGRAAVAGRRARHLRLPRRRLLAVGAAEPLPGGDRRGPRPGRQGDRDVRLPLPGGRRRATSGCSSTGRSSRRTSWPTSASSPVRWDRRRLPCPARARRPRAGGGRADGARLAEGEGGLHAGPGAAAALKPTATPDVLRRFSSVSWVARHATLGSGDRGRLAMRRRRHGTGRTTFARSRSCGRLRRSARRRCRIAGCRSSRAPSLVAAG